MGIAGSKQGTLAAAASIHEDDIDGQDMQERLVAMKRRRSLSAVESQPQKRLRDSKTTTEQDGHAEDFMQIPAVSRLEIPNARSPSMERLDYPNSETYAEAIDAPRLCDTIPACIAVASTELAETMASIHVATSDDSSLPLQDAQHVPLTLTQLEMNRKLLQKAIVSLQGETFRGTSLQQSVIGTRLEAPHHRLRDGRLPWQVVKRSDMLLKSAEPGRSSTKRACDNDDQDQLRIRKRLRRTLKNDLVSEGDLELPCAGMKGRQRIVNGVWPRDGIGGLERRGELARRS